MGRKRIGPYVHVMKKDFATADFRIAVFEIGPSQSQRLDLRAEQDHAGLILIEDEIVVPGLTILAYDLGAVHLNLSPLRLASAQMVEWLIGRVVQGPYN